MSRLRTRQMLLTIMAPRSRKFTRFKMQQLASLNVPPPMLSLPRKKKNSVWFSDLSSQNRKEKEDASLDPVPLPLDHPQMQAEDNFPPTQPGAVSVPGTRMLLNSTSKNTNLHEDSTSSANNESFIWADEAEISGERE